MCANAQRQQTAFRWASARSAAGIPFCVVSSFVFLLTCLRADDSGADHVELVSDRRATARLQLEGEILDYTGRAIRIRMKNGLEKSFASERVLAIDATWLDQHRQAGAAWNVGDLALATKLYSQALGADTRIWVRRLLLSRVVYCLWAQGQDEQAAVRFLSLLTSDPDTPYFGAIPLAWDASERVSKAAATGWLAQSEQPAAVLLGASYLLATDARPKAVAALQELRKSPDAHIASLAESQLWRTRVFQATDVELATWQRQIKQMPTTVRAGPYFLVGQTLLRQKRFDEAALALMQVRILYPDAIPLAAAALIDAADAFAGSQQIDQAARLYQEAEQTFPQTRWHRLAVERLRSLRTPAPEKEAQ